VLSNGPLEWLIGEARKANAQVKHHMEQLVLGEPVEPMPDMPDEITRVGILKDLYRKPTITQVHKSLHGPWLLLELLPHRYYDKDDGAENWRTPLGMRRRLPSGTTRLADKKTIEQKTYVHKTAKELMEREDFHYAPPNIVGGVASLKPADDVPGQDPGTIFLYDPPQDPKPYQNQAWYRWSVMIGITALELAVLAAAGVAVVKGIRRL